MHLITNKSLKIETINSGNYHNNFNISKGPKYPYLKDGIQIMNLEKVETLKTPKFGPNPRI